MERRRLGRLGHMSSVLNLRKRCLGAASSEVSTSRRSSIFAGSRSIPRPGPSGSWRAPSTGRRIVRWNHWLRSWIRTRYSIIGTTCGECAAATCSGTGIAWPCATTGTS